MNNGKKEFGTQKLKLTFPKIGKGVLGILKCLSDKGSGTTT